MTELLPCPLCDSSDVKIINASPDPYSLEDDAAEVYCSPCGTRTRPAFGKGCKEEVTKRWNTRPERDRLKAELAAITPLLNRSESLLIQVTDYLEIHAETTLGECLVKRAGKVLGDLAKHKPEPCARCKGTGFDPMQAIDPHNYEPPEPCPDCAEGAGS